MKDHITVCIITFHRNETLAHLLKNLSNQVISGLFKFSVVVVDNDSTGRAPYLVLSHIRNLI